MKLLFPEELLESTRPYAFELPPPSIIQIPLGPLDQIAVEKLIEGRSQASQSEKERHLDTLAGISSSSNIFRRFFFFKAIFGEVLFSLQVLNFVARC